ncbi:PREDICTED: ATP-dependent RNA helicase DDX24-like [Branchiostoma belcheri]|uniref:ATP-dependent RNA helicase n=1 Tax=Branchiostoma belcheri TaxID=7741 RepID=A0A6P4ZYC5_BRABE|nr:PREDICTED: ATP-dependent RNA helicase DDX24-like [Branchiostoma belcheri]
MAAPGEKSSGGRRKGKKSKSVSMKDLFSNVQADYPVPRRTKGTAILEHGSWKPVKVDQSLFSSEDFSGFVGLEELTEYELCSEGKQKQQKSTKKQKKKTQKQAKDHDDANIEEDETIFKMETKVQGTEEESTKSKTQNTMKKLKRKAQGEEEGQVMKINRNQLKDGPNDDNDINEEVTEPLKKKQRAEVSELSSQEKDESKSESVDQTGTDADAASEGVTKKSGKSRKERRNERRKQRLVMLKRKREEQRERKKQERKTAPLAKENSCKLQSVAKKSITADMSSWTPLYVPDVVLRGLADQGFTQPTPIQVQTIPQAIQAHKDVVGAAETGSGKTLAFGIPILHRILEWKERNCQAEDGQVPENTSDDDDDQEMEGVEEEDHNVEEEEEEELVLDSAGLGCVHVEDDITLPPELEALQQTPPQSVPTPLKVVSPLLALVLTPTRELAVQVANHIKAAAKYTNVKVAVLVGGMAPQKQKRVLDRQPEIIVATPGRLWEMVEQGHPHLSDVNQLQCLVIDEADRMVEKGHFAELGNLLDKINGEGRNRRRQTFVFSATLTMVHSGPQRKIMKRKFKMDKDKKLGQLMDRVGIRSKPLVVDLSRQQGTVDTLTEARITCATEEKDIYLYYFLLQYPGRTLVFANSIDCIRRLTSLLGLLQKSPLPLHANMHQKQRLKNLERFSANENGLLLATDVAARGLDIPDVQHVIHYQVPRTSETYVHRSGRTARAQKEGLTLLLTGPEDAQYYRRICKTLGKDEDLPVFPTEPLYLAAVKARVAAARRIDVGEHRYMKKKHHNDWFLQQAKEMDIELDEDEVLHDLGDTQEQDKVLSELKDMKKSLSKMLKAPIFPKGFSGLYPIQYGQPNLPRLPNAVAATLAVNNSRKKKPKI